MAIRTTAEAVAEIILLDDTVSVTPFIEIASSMVTSICVPLTYSAVELELIERWLSAHFYAVRESRVKTEKADVVSQTVQSKVDLGFNITHYGQQALLIDYKGGLAAVQARAASGKGTMASITHLGC